MADQIDRIPKPLEFGPVDPEAIAELYDVVPPGAYSSGEYTVGDLLGDNLPSTPSRRMFELIQPMVEESVGQYSVRQPYTPDTVKLTVTNGQHVPNGPKWKRSAIFPGELWFLATAHGSMDFAYGEGVPLIGYPSNALLNGVTNALISVGRLHIMPTEPNRLYAFGPNNISRGTLPEGQETEVTVGFGVYSSFQAMEAVYHSRVTRMRLSLLANHE